MPEGGIIAISERYDMRLLIGAAAVLLATEASAQTVVDTSGANIPAGRLQEALQIVAGTFADPKSARFRNLASSVEHTIVCGEVNAKDATGGYAGYRAFHMVGARAPMLAPDPGDPDNELFGIAMDNCRGPKP